MKDYYQILGVPETASVDEIKKSYRKMSKQYHPDVNPNGADKFKEISEAYENLSDSEKRNVYDNQRKNPFGFSSGAGDINDLLNHLFNQNRTRRPSAPEKIITVSIGVVDSFLGINKPITYLRNIACNSCNGNGGERKKCSDCSGSGTKLKRTGNGFFSQTIQTICDTCSGNGSTIVNPCFSCSGNGFKTQTDNLNMNLPIGVQNGSLYRVQGKGDFKNSMYGDLIIKVNIEPQNNFERIDNDLVYTKIFTLDELNLDKIEIPHPSGNLTITLPETFDTSIPLRVKGKGFRGSGHLGDLLIKKVVRFKK
jgi:molecular chaperone DnaJ